MDNQTDQLPPPPIWLFENSDEDDENNSYQSKKLKFCSRNLIQDDQSSTSTTNSFTNQLSSSTGDIYSVNCVNSINHLNSIKNCKSSTNLNQLSNKTNQLNLLNNSLNYQLNQLNSSNCKKFNEETNTTEQLYYSKCNNNQLFEQCTDCSINLIDNHNSIILNQQQSEEEECFDDEDDEDDLICCSSPECKLTNCHLNSLKNKLLNNNQSIKNCNNQINLLNLHTEENRKSFIQLKIYIPEFAVEKCLIVSKKEKIFKLKLYILDLIETIKQNSEQQQRELQLFFSNTTWSKSANNLNLLLNNNNNQLNNKFNKSDNYLNKEEKEKFIFNLNYGLFIPLLGRFLEEERTIGDYSQLINNFIFYNNLKKNFAQDSGKFNEFNLIKLNNSQQNSKLKSGNKLTELDLQIPIYHFIDQHIRLDKSTFTLNLNQQKLYGLNKVNENLNILNNLVRKVIKYNYLEIEFRYKQRVELLINMSTTLPTSTQTKKRRKRTRLLEAIAAGNVDKVTKLIQNCDPNFVDELSGETPLTLVCSLHTTQTVATSASLNSQNLTNGHLNSTNSSHDTKSLNLQNGNNLSNSNEKEKKKESKFFTLKSSSDKKESNNEDAHPYINPKNVFNPNVIQRLLVVLVNAGALLDFRAKESGRTALHVAVCKSNLIAIKTLLDLGCSPNHVDSNGLTPLYYSIIYRCSPKTTQQLLQHHACLNTRDNNGWCEIHHCCKFGSISQLELLLYYGCAIDAQISGSGNTGLHVSAINDQQECCRVLLQRGANKEIVNGSHQTAYQVALIANNNQLAELIANHKPENVQKYPEKPKFNQTHTKKVQLSTADSFEYSSVHGGKIRDDFGVKYCNSPCLSQRSNATTTATNTTNTSGICSEETTSNHSGYMANTMRVQGRKSCLSQNQQIANYATLPNRGRTDERKLTATNSIDSTGSNCQKITNCQQPQIISYNEKTVILKRNSNKGFGFVLRGAKAPSPTADQPSTSKETQCKAIQANSTTPINSNKENMRNQSSSPPQFFRPLSLQYFEDIEIGGVADQAGLRPGDYLVNVNGVDVRTSVHEYVVSLIRQSGDQVTITVATPIYQYDDSPKQQPPQNLSSIDQKVTSCETANQPQSQISDSRKSSIITEEVYDLTNKKATLSPSTTSRNSSTRCSAETLVYGTNNLPNSNSDQLRNKALPPAPPKRDPNTTLSISRARAKSLCINDLIDPTLPPAPDNLSPIEPLPPTNHTTVIKSNSNFEQIKNTSNNLTNASNKQTPNGISNYDSEGRSTKSSSPSSPSVQSIIHNVRSNSTTVTTISTQQSNKLNNESSQDSGTKVASIRSRSSRRISAFELEDYFSRQTEENDKSTNTQINGVDKCGTLQTPKRKEKSNLEKKTHSTSDLQAEVEESNVNNNQNTTNNQNKSHFETLTLKNGKFISNNKPHLVKQVSIKEPNENKPDSKENKISSSNDKQINECKSSSSISTLTSSSFKTSNSIDKEKESSDLHIPEPDYSDDDKQTNKMSTFKTPLESNNRLTQSVYETKDQQQEINNGSLDDQMSKSMIANQNKLNKNLSANKVKESIKQFERRNVSLDGSKRKLESLENMINSTQNGLYGTTQAHNTNRIPTSKSCFEVDVCDLNQSDNKDKIITSTTTSNLNKRNDQHYYTLVKQNSGANNHDSRTAKTNVKAWNEIEKGISTAIRAGKLNSPNNATVSSLNKPAIKGAIRLQVDSLGLAGKNEIDVTQDVLLPPPEYRTGITSTNLISGTQLLQQQVHQAKQQQLLQAQHKLHQSNKGTNKDEIKIIAAQQKQPPQIINDPNTTLRKNINTINASNLDAVTKARLLQQIQQQQQQQTNVYLPNNITVSQANQLNSLNSSQFATLTRYVKQQQLQAQQQTNQNNQQYVAISRLVDPQQTQNCQLHNIQSQNNQEQQLNLYGAAVSQQQVQQQQQQQPPTSTNQTNYYQFATLSRAAVNNRAQNPTNLYNDYNNKLNVQNRLIKQQANLTAVNQTGQLNQLQQPTTTALTQAQLLQLAQQQPQLISKNINGTSTLNVANLDPATRARLIQQQQQVQLLLLQRQQQQLKTQYQIQQQQKAIMLSKKPIENWSSNDVSEWFKAIGLMEYSNKFSDFDGSKLLQLDINELNRMDIKQQHRQFILEKLNQHKVYQLNQQIQTSS